MTEEEREVLKAGKELVLLELALQTRVRLMRVIVYEGPTTRSRPGSTRASPSGSAPTGARTGPR